MQRTVHALVQVFGKDAVVFLGATRGEAAEYFCDTVYADPDEKALDKYRALVEQERFVEAVEEYTRWDIETSVVWSQSSVSFEDGSE